MSLDPFGFFEVSFKFHRYVEGAYALFKLLFHMVDNEEVASKHSGNRRPLQRCGGSVKVLVSVLTTYVFHCIQRTPINQQLPLLANLTPWLVYPRVDNIFAR